MRREPPEETTDLYTNLVVDDRRVSGSITAGATRLPLWAFVPQLITGGWNGIEEEYPSAAQIGADGLAEFLSDLLDARGEFGRLLLTLADAARHEHPELAPAGGGGAAEPRGWWQDPELARPVRKQLERCLALLPDDTTEPRT